MARVRRPYERVSRIVKNNGGYRSTKNIKLIVLHTTEGHDRKGIEDIKGLGDFFNNPAVKASSHVAVDGEGYSARYVPDSMKAWTQGYYNGVSLSVEQIGFAKWSRWFWQNRRDPQLRKTAKYIAYWCAKYDIPIRKGKVRGGDVVRSGVIRHSELGALGGNHSDPGKGYPMHSVLAMARKYQRNGW